MGQKKNILLEINSSTVATQVNESDTESDRIG
jgi:hypothetical protein